MNAKGRLLELDCLRGIAVIFVITFHFTLGEPNLKPYFRFGCTGVDLFFMISGFVIFLTIEKTKHWKDFLISRFSRLFPAYWTGVTLTTLFILGWSAAIKSHHTFPDLTAYLVNLTMIPSYFNVRYIDGVYWTLLVELLFYLLMLGIFLVKKLNQIEWICFFTLILCLVNGILFKAQLIGVHDFFKQYLPILTFFPLFAAGIMFYRIKFHKITLYRCLLIVFCLVVQVALFDDTGKAGAMTMMQYTLIVAVYFALFFLYTFNWLGFIVNKVTLFLGKISYSLYLIHDYIAFFILIPLFTNTKHFHFNYLVADFLIVLPIIIIMAALINRFVEIPAMHYLRKKWSSRKAEPVANERREF